ncbi:hypothetical protein CBL_10008 [Carabus blaptoides fortunei]
MGFLDAQLGIRQSRGSTFETTDTHAEEPSYSAEGEDACSATEQSEEVLTECTEAFDDDEEVISAAMQTYVSSKASTVAPDTDATYVHARLAKIKNERRKQRVKHAMDALLFTALEEEADEEEQRKQWHYSGACPTGFECVPDGNCTGSWAQRCFDDSTFIHKGPTNIKFQGQRYMLFPKHTCVSSWACQNVVTDVPIQIDEESPNHYPFYTTENGQKITIDNKLYVIGSNTTDGYLHYLLDPMPSLQSALVKAKCYSISDKDTKCVITTDGDWKGITFDLGEKDKTTFRNAIMHVTGKIMTIRNGEMTRRGTWKESDNFTRNSFTTSNLRKAASIGDVVEIVNSLAILQMQSLYNLHMANLEIHKNQEILTNMIKSLSKIDSKLIGSIDGGSYSVKWINDQRV